MIGITPKFEKTARGVLGIGILQEVENPCIG